MSADQLWIIGADKPVLDAIRLAVKTHVPEEGEVSEGYFYYIIQYDIHVACNIINGITSGYNSTYSIQW